MTFKELSSLIRQKLNDSFALEVTNEEVLINYNLALANLELILTSALVPFNECEVEVRSGDELPTAISQVQSVISPSGSILSLANFASSDERFYYIVGGRIYFNVTSATLKYSQAFDRVSILSLEEELERQVPLTDTFLEYVIYSIIYQIEVRLGEDASSLKAILESLSQLLTLSHKQRYGYQLIRGKRLGYE